VAVIRNLKLLPLERYRGVNENDPIRYYFYPVFGRIYRHRVELCLNECNGGERMLEVGFGSGLTFLNLHEIYREIHGLDLTSDVGVVKGVFDALNIPTFLQNGNVLDMPYTSDFFDAVLLISILEHLQTAELEGAFREIYRVLKPGGQMVYGVPVERPLMVSLFRLLGYDIRKLHFSTEKDVAEAAKKIFSSGLVKVMRVPARLGVSVYQIGHFNK
jgi:ubiquinone/menaquinone biosynthesis C-methylase UbiE